jgi:FdhD protein
MKDVGSVDYEIHRVEGLTREISADCIAIEEPLEIIVRYYKGNDWVIEPLM